MSEQSITTLLGGSFRTSVHITNTSTLISQLKLQSLRVQDDTTAKAVPNTRHSAPAATLCTYFVRLFFFSSLITAGLADSMSRVKTVGSWQRAGFHTLHSPNLISSSQISSKAG